MPIDLHQMLASGEAAVLTMEVQRGVVGDLSHLPDLRDAVTEVGLLDQINRLLKGARRVGVPVVHCTVGPEAVASAPPNYPGAAALAKRRAGRPEAGSSHEVATEIGPEATDFVVNRHQGVSPFTGTELDGVLRRLGVKTVVASGVSLNVGIIGLTIEAVSLGYRVVVAQDAVAGVPVEYGRSVLANTMPFLATRLSVDDICDVWERAA